MYWMAYGTNWFIHFRAMSECLQRLGAVATCNMETGALDVLGRGRRIELFPQFGLFRPGGIGYTQALSQDTHCFIGWRPYANRFWPLAFDKRAFKDFCRGNGVAVPRRWNRPEEVEADVLVKRGVSSFSEGIRGPFTPGAVKRAEHSLADGEFFEEFIAGDILKVWYWNAAPVCLEVVPMPTVAGDGARTLRQLIHRAKFPHVDGDWPAWQAIAEYQGLSLDTVLANGRKVLVEFRYQSSLHPVLSDFPNPNVLTKYTDTKLLEQLRFSGEIFWRGIPDALRQNTLFTVDGILGRDGIARFVEMNSNPSLPPDVYGPMLETLLDIGVSSQARRSPRAIPQSLPASSRVQ